MPTAKLELKTPGELLDEIMRLRKALSQIAWMDEFLDQDAAKEMMLIAREALGPVPAIEA